jgi:hypothetical protein
MNYFELFRDAAPHLPLLVPDSLHLCHPLQHLSIWEADSVTFQFKV